MVALTTITARDLRNDYARVLRAVEAGETFTVTSRGRPVAEIAPAGRARPGPRPGVPFAEIAGSLSYLGDSVGGHLRAEVDDAVDTAAEDPFERWERHRSGEATGG